MTVYFLGAGPGDPELLTGKALRLLRECRFCVFAGSLISPEVLDLLPGDAERHDSARLTLGETISLIQQAHGRNLDVIRLHSGDPTIYSAIGEQMDALDALNIDYEVVPGVSSFQAAAASLKVELTVPECSQTVILGRLGGRTPVPDTQSLDRLGATRSTLCLFLSAHKLPEVVSTLLPFYGVDCPAAVVYRASRPDQRIVRGCLGELAQQVADAGISRTALILVGQALCRGGPTSRLYHPEFAHGYRRAKA
jgi:precorrin-4/cobalt-precorrin-4 C11-methyltransferase